MRILKAAQHEARAPFQQVALYGALIHVVVPNASRDQDAIRTLLNAEGVQVHSMDWIAPTLEDVFISSVSD